MTDLVLSEGVDQSAIDVVNGDAEGCDEHVLGHSHGEGVPLVSSYS